MKLTTTGNCIVILLSSFLTICSCSVADIDNIQDDTKIIKGKYHFEISSAVNIGDIGWLERLVSQGGDVNSSNSISQMTPLHFAALKNQLGAIEFLLESGADPNAINILGQTPMMIAKISGNHGAAELIKNAGGQLNYKN